MTFRPRRESASSKVFRILLESDDFMTAPQIREGLPDENVDRLSSALSNLYRYHAVDFITEGRTLFWYATPERDTRTKTYDDQPERPRTMVRKRGYKRPNRHLPQRWR